LKRLAQPSGGAALELLLLAVYWLSFRAGIASESRGEDSKAVAGVYLQLIFGSWRRAAMKIVALICRILLGLIFVVFGLNGFFHFIPMKGPMPPADSLAGQFSNSMMKSGWMAHVSFFQVVGGALVWIGGTAPLGLVLLGPIIANILMFHILMMSGRGIGMGAFAALLEIILIWAYRANFAGIFTMRARPVA